MNRLALAALLGLTILRLLMAHAVPLTPDEAYYTIWSQHLQADYYDDAPMVAYWIHLGIVLVGRSALGVRLVGPLAAACGSVLLWRAGEDMFPGRQVGLIAAALLNATLMLGAGSVLMTPDTPLLFFWTATLAVLARFIASGQDRWLLAAGVLAGAAMLSKYTGLLLIVAIGLWLLTNPQGRAALRRPAAWAGLALAGLLCLPMIIWNIDHHEVSFLKQGGRVAQFAPGSALNHLGELIGGQIGLATPLIFALMAVGVWRAARGGPAERLLAWLVVVPGALFIEHVLSGRVQANWPAILYPAAALAAASCYAGRRTLISLALASGLAITLLVYGQVIYGVLPIPPQRDPAALQLAGWSRLARTVASRLSGENADYVAADDYATAAELAWHMPPDTVILVHGGRWAYFGLPVARDLTDRAGLLVQKSDRPPPAFAALLAGDAQRLKSGVPVARYQLFRVSLPAPAYVLKAP